MPAAEVEFHEVGAVDSIVDIVGVCVALELLDVDAVEASSVAQGTGTFRAAHGVLPNPPPAVVALLAGAGIPSHGLDVPFELTTPTGAALLAALGRRFGPMPAMTVTASGFGAGGRELAERANHVQVVLGDADGGAGRRRRLGRPARGGAGGHRRRRHRRDARLRRGPAARGGRATTPGWCRS